MSKPAFPFTEKFSEWKRRQGHIADDQRGMSMLEFYAGHSSTTIAMVEEFLKEREQIQLLKMKNESSENYYRYLSGKLAAMKFTEAEAMEEEAEKRSK